MKITLEAGNETSCTLKSATVSSSNAFTIPISATSLVTALRNLLADPETRDVSAGDVMLVGLRDWIAVHVGSDRFTIPYRNALALVMDA